MFSFDTREAAAAAAVATHQGTDAFAPYTSSAADGGARVVRRRKNATRNTTGYRGTEILRAVFPV